MKKVLLILLSAALLFGLVACNPTAPVTTEPVSEPVSEPASEPETAPVTDPVETAQPVSTESETEIPTDRPDEKPTTAVTTVKSEATSVKPKGERIGVDFTLDFDAGEEAFVLLDKTLDKAPITVEAWIKLPENCKGMGGMILSDQIVTDPAYFDLEYMSQRQDTPAFSFYVNDKGNPGLFCYNGIMGSGHGTGDGSYNYVVENCDVRTGEWVHIAFVRDISRDTITFYLNGQRFAQATDVVTTDFALEQRMGIGGDMIACNSAHFKGEISDLRAWSVRRTDKQIADNYKGTVAADTKGLQANWLLEEDGASAAVFADTTGKHNARKHPFWQSEEEWSLPKNPDGCIICLPDTQVMARSYTSKLTDMMEYIAENKAAYNLKFVMHVGDQTNGNEYGRREKGLWEAEWDAAKKAMKKLTDAGIPFSICAGNHDYDETKSVRDTSLMNESFPVSLQKSYSCFGGAYDDSNDNTYYLLDIGKTKYLVLSLEFGPRNAVIDWANKVVADHADRYVIVISHDIVSPSGKFSHKPMLSAASNYSYLKPDVNNGQDLWDKLLKKHKNIAIVVGGHWTSECILHRTDVGDNGNVVHSFQIDFTSAEFYRRGVEMFVPMVFTNGGKTVTMAPYSPLYGWFLGDMNHITFEIGK